MILSLATLVCNGVSIVARESDGYINLNLLAQANGKRLGDWMRLKDTKQYLRELSDQGITPFKASKQRNHPDFGTWGDTRVALKLATWISKPFEAMVYQWIGAVVKDGYMVSPAATQQQLGNAAKAAISGITDLAIVQGLIVEAEDQQIVAIREQYARTIKNLKNSRDCATKDAYEYFEGEALRNELKEYNEQYAEEYHALIAERDEYLAEIQALIDKEKPVISYDRALKAS